MTTDSLAGSAHHAAAVQCRAWLADDRIESARREPARAEPDEARHRIMGSPPLYPQFDDDGPAGSHPAPGNSPRPAQPEPTPPPTTVASEPPKPEPTRDALEESVHGRNAARAQGVDDLLSVIGNLGDQLEAFKALRAEHEREAERLAELERSLGERQRAMEAEEARQAELKAKLATANSAMKQQQERLKAREEELATRERTLAERESQAESLCEQSLGLAEQAEADKRTLAERLRELDEREALARAMQTAAKEQIDSAAVRLAEERSAAAWREQAESTRAEADATRAELESTRHQYAEQLEASRRGEQASMAEWEQLSEETASLRKKLAAAEREAESLRQSSLTAEAVESMVDEAVNTARARWESERACAETIVESADGAGVPVDDERVEALRLEAERASKELAEERSAREALERRAEQAEKALEQFKQAPPAPGTAGSGDSATNAPPDWEKQLRKRDQAIRALKEHLEAAEAKALERDQLFRLREEVHAERDRVKVLAKVTQRKAARSGGAFATMFLMIALVAAAFGSWMMAGHFSPATYLAEATIAPDEREGTLRSAHVESWMMYHRSLLNDPIFIERAAERLQSRGFTEMGTPVLLRQVIADRMAIDNADSGGLTISLRGVGSTPTERALDIFVTTLINHANAARDLRLDRTSSVVISAASSGDRPVEDPRTRLFGIIFGALAAVALIAFAMVSRWLANAPINAGDHMVDLNDSTHGYEAHLADSDAHRRDPESTRGNDETMS